LVRKKGQLQQTTISPEFALEYGELIGNPRRRGKAGDEVIVVLMI